MIRYSTNWMGPVNTQWIAENGQDWSAGRIDIYGTDNPYNLEIALPVMKTKDWILFSDWLRTFETDTVYSLDELVSEYEKNNDLITWFK